MNAVPIIHYRGKQADEAFTRYSALLKAARDCPALASDMRFQAMRSESYSAFRRAFEVA